MTDPKIKDSLNQARAAAQELHGAISDAAAKRGGAMKADLETVPQKAKVIMESIRSSLGTQEDATKKHLKEAMTNLETAQKHAMESMKSSGQAFQTSVRKTLADARSSVEQISEALAEKRSAESKKTRK
ncbi:MAG TPA: hypothetical protein VMT45_09075 [Thermoanaerobaculaceae bacterium]|nr:hypothetical protein [Thermoanaerobaculaceae bacterium]